MTTFTDKEMIKEIKERIGSLDVRDNIERRAYEIALASLEAEPVAWLHSDNGLGIPAITRSKNVADSWLSKGWYVQPLYIAKPVPVVPDARPSLNNGIVGFDEGWNACRATMLHGAKPVSQTYKLNKLSGNSPVTPDGWISCSDRMPEKGQNVLISVNFDSSLVEPLICSARYTGSTFRRGDATIKPGNGIEQATHWMPLPEPPQEAK
ncbi:DUF551 domain-containing protein [Salmonella enterica subsp. enterica]|uniref:DUF551 domain-containing protein n=1 Tax=Salmonella enterica I TaxID=59201 RepID=A0A5Y3IAZ3_SALET|nr:DUF551 domain-containing protein [Salmonella enterica subsp. enterica]ECH8333622.1 DUF551 domain-containing protein [Salmonella enterica subsp. enterica]ECH9434736.1 DUF551 domain-containing protein [Salmonella enterica subsp. enterica]EDQ9921566.1 DUF551 domain-containing protein [Salmonella enterica subsp. enterica]